jgi:phosphoenolpyruvate phosphomutase / 2-hydroxyethylphosphonate cytidylyltransferase
MKKVYVVMSTDLIHPGHLRILNHAATLGDVIVGVLTDEAISSYKSTPIIDLSARISLFSNLKNVAEVVIQEKLDYTENLIKIRPDYVVHGDDWREGAQKKIRDKVISTLANWNGKLVEIPYSYDFNSSSLRKDYRQKTITPDIRRASLRTMLNYNKHISALEASNGLTGLIVENTKLLNEHNAVIAEFDAMWVSSLCDSTFKGKPDIELVDLSSRIATINEIMEVTTKPIILDGDTGGKIEHFTFNVKTLERIGVSAIIIEDKQGLKRNSLYGTDVQQELEDPQVFSNKIKAGKRAQSTRDFMIFARLESLIAGYDVDHAMERAILYISEGADGLMIHSKSKDGKDIFEFLRRIRLVDANIPLIVVPTTYNQFTESELSSAGANIIIHANHLLRSAYPSMVKTAESILLHGRSLEADQFCLPIKDVLSLIPTGDQDDQS